MTMYKKVLLFSVALLAALACEKVETVSDSADCTVTLNLVGEIETTETPLSKAGSANDLYAIQVYQGSDVFAWGIFDDISNLQINLKQEKSYSVRVVKVAEAKIHLNSYFSLTNNGFDGYSRPISTVGPFRVYYNTSDNTYSDFFIRTNKFFYKFIGKFEYYKSSTTTSVSTNSNTFPTLQALGTGSLNGVSYPTCTDWFYGESGSFVANGETLSVSIPLKRTGFKLKYTISGITDGSVTVTIKNSARTFFQATTTTPSYESDTQFIAFGDTKSAWQYADNYMENLTVSVSWARGIGVTQNLGSKKVSIKRNCLNTINITLGNDDRSAGVSLNVEDDSGMGSASNTITVE